MSTPLNLLIAEDCQDDVDLVLAELRRSGYTASWQRVETEPDFLAELKKNPDIILSDYAMPEFSGPRAIQLLRRSGLDIPLILISGTVGEDAAVEAMKLGATDYLLKDRLARLGQVVQRVLEEKRLREDRRRAEKALRESDRRFREMLENVGLIAVIVDRNATLNFCNDYLLELTGWKREEVLGHDWFATFVPESDQEVRRLFFGKIADGTFPGHYENSIRTRLGEIREIVWSNTLLKDELGNFTGTASIGVDVTERKRAEANLRESELKFRQLAENINEVFWITDPARNHILYVSPTYEKIWERSCDSLYADSNSWLEAIHPDDSGRVRQAVITKLASGRYDEEYRILRQNKEVRWIHDRAFPVLDAEGKIYRIVGTAEDITLRKSLEEQFRQVQKMEGIGQLAGGVAHDFNNILAIIQMYAEVVRMSGSLSAEQSDCINEISATVQRAAALTRQLLLFSRREVFQPRDLNLSDSITNTTKMLKRTLGENIQVQLKLAPEPVYIHADAAMMDQVLLNLSVNARDAMPNGGRLVIETGKVELDEFAASQAAAGRAGSYVCLTVSDDGCGIPPEILPKIFDPFFTTKDVGKGTGLGLSIVFGIVQQHRGWINVYSEIGHGTTFKLYLPRLEKNIESDASRSPSLCEMRGGFETILLVEDDPSLRDSVHKALTQLNYRVLDASTGVKALEIWKENPERIDLLLADLVMPDGMTGKELAERIQQHHPALKVIFMSGYSAEVVGKDFPLKEGVNFLIKPFPILKLAQTVRARLDG